MTIDGRVRAGIAALQAFFAEHPDQEPMGGAE